MEKIEKSLAERKQIKKMPNKKEKTIEALSAYQIEKIEGLIDAITASGIDEFSEYIRSPWKMFWPNFIAGVTRGFGALVGATIVIALVGWVLSTLIDLPLIGEKLKPYVGTLQEEFKEFTEANNYRENFERIEESLYSIDKTLQKQGTLILREQTGGTIR